MKSVIKSGMRKMKEDFNYRVLLNKVEAIKNSVIEI